MAVGELGKPWKAVCERQGERERQSAICAKFSAEHAHATNKKVCTKSTQTIIYLRQAAAHNYTPLGTRPKSATNTTTLVYSRYECLELMNHITYIGHTQNNSLKGWLSFR